MTTSFKNGRTVSEEFEDGDCTLIAIHDLITAAGGVRGDHYDQEGDDIAPLNAGWELLNRVFKSEELTKLKDLLVIGNNETFVLEALSVDTKGDLSSERFGENYYIKLQDLLKAGKWKEADQETVDRMCEVMDQQEDRCLSREDIQFFPTQDLNNIDQLWLKYSNGKFGFSVQKKIYLECGAKPDGKYPGDSIWSKFASQTGWNIGLNKGDYFNTRWAGHLPTLLFWVDLWRGSWGLDKNLLILLLSRSDL